MKKRIKAIFTIIATIIGAGFASGQEIYSFFAVYGAKGFIGIIISSVLFGVIIYVVLKKANRINSGSYKELLQASKLPPKLMKVLNIIVNVFLLLSFFIMVAGFATYFNQEFGIPKIVVGLLAAIICYITFLHKIDGITKINNIMMPILIIIIFIIAIKGNVFDSIQRVQKGETSAIMWIIKSIEYASYNSILLIPILVSIRDYCKGKEKNIGIITSVILLLLSGIMFMLLQIYGGVNVFDEVEMPMVFIASLMGNIFRLAYGVVMVFSIYSTMVSSGYGFLTNLPEKRYKVFSIIMCVAAVIMSCFSFSRFSQCSVSCIWSTRIIAIYCITVLLASF